MFCARLKTDIVWIHSCTSQFAKHGAQTCSTIIWAARHPEISRLPFRLAGEKWSLKRAVCHPKWEDV